MHVQVHYQNLDNSPWSKQFVEDRVSKLNKYLSPSANIHVNLKYENKSYVTSLAIHNFHQDYAFNSHGENLYEALATAIDKAMRSLGEQKKKVKDRIHRKMFSRMKYEQVP